MAEPVSTDEQQKIEDIRNEEQWVRYDTIMVGPDATLVTQNGWKPTFSAFANEDLLTWNDGSRTKQIGKSYCNQSGNTEDFSQLVYQSGVEYWTPVGMGDSIQYISDLDMIKVWVQELPRAMSFSVKMQDTDEWLLVPGSHLPGGTGTTGAMAVDTGLPSIYPGQNGEPGLSQVWQWPKPLRVAAKKKLVVEATLDKPLKEFLQQLDANPGYAFWNVPDGQNPGAFKVVRKKMWFGIRVWHRGPRRVQLRGAYTA
jgi:hypothetical protein